MQHLAVRLRILRRNFQKVPKILWKLWVSHKSIQKSIPVNRNPFYDTQAYAGRLGFGFLANWTKSAKTLMEMWVSPEGRQKNISVNCNRFYYTSAYAGQLAFGSFAKFQQKVRTIYWKT